MEVKCGHSEVEAVFLPFLLFPLADVSFSETPLAEVPAFNPEISWAMREGARHSFY